MIEREPFLIGFQSRNKGGIMVDDPVVHIDMDSPRVNTSEGEVVFLEHGGNSPYLQRISSVLSDIHQGHEDNKSFSKALEKLELLEPFKLKIEFNNHSRHELSGFYTINEERFRLVNGEMLTRLHRSGYLEHIYMTFTSLSNLKTLIERKDERL